MTRPLDDKLDGNKVTDTAHRDRQRNVYERFREFKRLAKESASLKGLTDVKHTETNVFGVPVSNASQWRTISTGILEPGRSKPRPYLDYVFSTYKNMFITFYFKWSMFLTSPLSSIAFLTIYPTLVIALLLFEIGLKVFMEVLGGNELAQYLSIQYGQGAPQLLLSDSTADLVSQTLPTLGKPLPEENFKSTRRRTFDLSIAQTFVILASLIYERNVDKVKEAYKIASQLAETQGSDFDEDSNDITDEEVQAQESLRESEARIRSIAGRWGLHFAGVTELKSLGGPYCGIFWSEAHPFIVIAFKGTTPTNYEEFLVDATLQRTDANAFLYGCCHEGFYESVFPTSGFGNEDLRNPYGAILEFVHNKAREIQAYLKTTQPVQVWITGHSLGAAMSSLLFARFLKCPEDLPSSLCTLRDCYVIGTPAVGNSEFASKFASYMNMPASRSSMLWRIINKADAICHVPPGYDSKTAGIYMSDMNFFNYSHVGHAIQLTHSWHSEPLKMYPSSYMPTLQVRVTLGAYDSNKTNGQQQSNGRAESSESANETAHRPEWLEYIANQSVVQKYVAPRLKAAQINPIKVIEMFYPFFMKDHIPCHYFEGLQRAREYYSNELKQLQAKQRKAAP
ncbi:hypothetical protein EC973_000638 [Apophysomyces ossiformis]|uniref:Fungal lipase-type domain-containing protein n=1 Tax=Apophysomyces ossiformis TaxID=679940 RepID=A0A8H7BYN2_9FUNG|nr:hypothetical protein EC973_000638 [Apophysomyces ossiformis]